MQSIISNNHYGQSMNTYERHQAILQILQEQGSIKVIDLSEILNVSEGTIRNDLSALQDENLLMRVHGGAIPIEKPGNNIEPVFKSRVQINADSKKKIAKWASEIVSDGDVILMDASSTTFHMARYLEDRHNITVITNHIETARLLRGDPTKRIILLGGELKPDGLSVTGELGQVLLQHLKFNTAFISCVGFSMETGLMESDIREANLKRQIMESAAKVVALVDSSKFDKIGLRSFASVKQLSHLVTDDQINKETIEKLQQFNISLTICGESSVQSLQPTQSAKHYRIGFANLSEEIPFAIDVRRSLEQAARTTDQLDIIYVDNNLNGNTAIHLADELIDKNVDLVIEYQIDEAAGNIIMNKFNQHNIPVIAVDIPMVGATYFGVNNFISGYMAGCALGKWIHSHWNNEVDRIIILEEKRAGALPGARIHGQLEGLEEIVGHIDDEYLLYIDSGNSAQTSYSNSLSILKELPKGLKIAFICFNDDAAIGALDAVQDLKIEDHVVIVGQGADRKIREVLVDLTTPIIGSTAFMPEKYGEKLVEIAFNILNNIPVPPAVYIDHTFIDLNNVHEFYD